MMNRNKVKSEANKIRTKLAFGFAVNALLSWLLCALFIFFSTSKMGPISTSGYLLLPVFWIYILLNYADGTSLSFTIISIITLVGAILLPFLKVVLLRPKIVAYTIVSHMTIIIYFLWNLVLIFSLWT